MTRTFDDPVLELAMRTGGGPESVLDLANATTDEEAEIVLGVLDEVEAEQRASGIVARLQREGHLPRTGTRLAGWQEQPKASTMAAHLRQSGYLW